MPHQVLKTTAVGSVGDLARITGALEGLGVNILAIGGGEGVTDEREVGVISMIIDPEDPTTTDNVLDTLRNLELAGGTPHVELVANIHILLLDKVGQLRRAVDAIGDINIRSIVSMGLGVGASHVGIGVAPDDHEEAERRLRDAGIIIVPHEEESGA